MKIKRLPVILIALMLIAISACKKNNPKPPVQTNQCTGPEIVAESTLADYIKNPDGTIADNDLLTSDAAGNMYVANLTGYTTMPVNGITGNVTADLNKFDASGKLIYAKAVLFSSGAAISADSLGDVYAGYLSVLFAPYHCIVNLVKYNSAGDTVWGKHIYYDSDASFSSLGVRSDGSTLVAAQVLSVPLDHSYFDPSQTGNAGSGNMVYSFDPNGNLTHVKQVHSYAYHTDFYQFFPSGGFYDMLYNTYPSKSISVSNYDANLNLLNSNNVAVTEPVGLFYDTKQNAYFTDSTSITKLNATFGTTWQIKTQPYQLITSDLSGNIYISGTFNGIVNFGLGSVNESLTAKGKNDSFIEKIDTNGNLIWVTQSLGTDGKNYAGASQVNNLIITSKNEIFVTGTALNTKTNANIHFAALYTQCN